MQNQFSMCYADGRRSVRFDTLQDAIAHVALSHENVEFTPDGQDVRVRIGPLTLGKITKRQGWDN